MKIEINPKWRSKSWSFSALSDYEECPWRYYLTRAEKMLSDKSPALENGIMIHEAAEQFLKGEISSVPESLMKFETELTNIKTKTLRVEEAICLDRRWQPVEGADPWASSKTWIRGRLDMRIGNFVVDLKSGNEYPKYKIQAELYATMLFQQFQQYNEFEFEFWYTKTGNVTGYIFNRAQHQENMRVWDDRANRLMLEKTWTATRNANCRWCHCQDACPHFGAQS